MNLPVPQAQELTREEFEARAKRCYELHQSIAAGLRAGREALWATARDMDTFDQEDGWSALGYESLHEWLADPEIGMTDRTFRRLLRCWRAVARQAIPDDELGELDLSKVDLVLSAVEVGHKANGKRVTLKRALRDVKALGWRDLREEYLKAPPPALEPGDDDGEDWEMEEGTALATDDAPISAAEVLDSVDPTGPTAEEVIAHLDHAIPSAPPSPLRDAAEEARTFIRDVFPSS